MSRAPRPGQKPNRLADQTSPYLLQHRYNPVDWWPWGEEAFAEARRRDVPVFLSIGYSTCYWCHVMERECFEDEAIAATMNRLFVNIKVDREERPDVDDVYMAAVQAFAGRGGWPMSVFLEPGTLKPFYAGTYFPATPRYAGMPSFPQLLEGLSGAFTERRAEVLEQAGTLADAVRERVTAEHAPVRLSERHVGDATVSLLKIHDRVHGGFGGAPKFPQPVYLELLLAVRQAAGDEETRSAIDAALRTTLDRMALGGMFDQVGGGFHRYSVDEKWLVPHFEKMLYDNAQLAEVYAKASRVYSDAFYARIARRTLAYVLREMTAAEGGFFSAQDAEVNHREGQNYLWTREQIAGAFPPGTGDPGEASLAGRLYGLDGGPNFRDPHHPSDTPANVLFLSDRPEKLSAGLKITEAELLASIDRINGVLLAARSQRDQPATDDKSLAGWNGLMIGALATGGTILNEPAFVRAAARAADFVLARMRDENAVLLRSFRAGTGTIPAFLEDHAQLIQGLIALHSAGNDPDGVYLRAATDLLASAESRFADGEGGYFDTLADQPDLFVRARTVYDGAVPSGVGVLIHCLIDLGRLTGETAYTDRAARALRAISGFVATTPLGACNSTRALLRLLSGGSGGRGAFDAAFEGVPDPAPGAPDDPDFSPVEILSAVHEVELAPDEPVAIVLRVRIKDGYHINAADPGPAGIADGLMALKVAIAGGSGVAVYADYPAGEPFHADPDLLVNSGEFDLTVALERSGEWKGRPLITVTYQACTEDACLKPRTVELDVSIDRR